MPEIDPLQAHFAIHHDPSATEPLHHREHVEVGNPACAAAFDVDLPIGHIGRRRKTFARCRSHTQRIGFRMRL